MAELPTPPFPELHALEQKRPVPTMAELLRGAHASNLPAPLSPTPERETNENSVLDVPRFPSASLSAESSPPDDEEKPTEAASAEDMPAEEEEREETMQETIAALLAQDTETLAAKKERPAGDPPPREPAETPAGESGDMGSDAELAEAFAPILESGFIRALRADQGLSAFLEPMLRSTVRRAIAEQMESSRQFRQLGAFDRLAFRLLALFSSRTYDDIVFDRTHRYQVEEAYLLRRESKTLVSYAHHDPGSHVSPRRVKHRVRELTHKLQGPDGAIETSFDLPQRRLALVREGKHCFLVAVLRGRSNALVRADLDYVLRQAEDRFGEGLEARTDAFLRVLQPILEGCLLIQSPAPPH